MQYVSKQDVLDTYRGYMQDYSSLWDEFETDNPFKANYRVTLSDLTQMERMSVKMQAIPGVVSVTAPVEMTNIFVEIQKAVTKGGRMIVLVLMVVSIITVGSTIRLSVFARRREIEIMKYVGATNRMVTLPFFVEGLTMGLISRYPDRSGQPLAVTPMWSTPLVAWAASGRCSWAAHWCR